MIIGVDEVGRGPIAGDLLVCAAYFKSDAVVRALERDGLRLTDSKKFSNASVRCKVADHLMASDDVVWRLARKSPAEIDQMGIHQAVLHAMYEAATAVKVALGKDAKIKEVLYDGKFVPSQAILESGGVGHRAVVKGDLTVPQISAASIVAKVTRDREMEALERTYPLYAFSRHSGYGTAQHIDEIKRFGLSPVHRSWAKKFESKNI